MGDCGGAFYGAAKSKDPVENRKLVMAFLGTLSVFAMDNIAAQFFGILKADLESSGRRFPDTDLWIGAIARANRAEVVTGNARHFDRMDGVAVENWMR